MTQSVRFDCDSEMATQTATQSLAKLGLRVVRSFDLRSALATHAGCECPHHGSEQCTCQFLVLLVYGPAGAPVVVSAHSRDGQAELQIVQDANTYPDAGLADQVMSALVEAALSVQGDPNRAGGIPVNAHQLA